MTLKAGDRLIFGSENIFFAANIANDDGDKGGDEHSGWLAFTSCSPATAPRACVSATGAEFPVVADGSGHSATVTMVRAWTPLARVLPCVISSQVLDHVRDEISGRGWDAMPPLRVSEHVWINETVFVGFSGDPSLRISNRRGGRVVVLAPGHGVQVNPGGGSGDYAFASSSAEVVSVGPGGRVAGHRIGTAGVRVADAANSGNAALVRVRVALPEVLAVSPQRGVVVVGGTPLTLYVTGTDARGSSFNNCSLVGDSMRWSVASSSSAGHGVGVGDAVAEGVVGADLATGVCGGVCIRGLHHGFAKVTGILARPGLHDLTVSAIVEVFEPLRIAHPSRAAGIVDSAAPGIGCSVLVALGSTVRIELSGGPRQGVVSAIALSGPPLLIRAVGSRGSGGTPSSQAQKQELLRHRFNITCLGIGTARVEFAGCRSDINSGPAACSAAIDVICAHPAVELVLLLGAHAGAQFKASFSGSEVVLPPTFHVRSVGAAFVWLDLFDSNHRVFDAYDSVAVRWSFEARDETGRLIPTSQLGLEVSESLSEGVLRVDVAAPTQWRHFVFSGTPGTIAVRASVGGYDAEALTAFGIADTFTLPPLSSALNLHAVRDVVLSPSTVVMLAHPAVRVQLLEIGGSGVFDVAILNSTGSMFVDKTEHGLFVRPNAQFCYGNNTVATSVVSVIDMGLVLSPGDTVRPSATASVTVSRIAGVSLAAPASLALGAMAPARVHAAASGGFSFTHGTDLIATRFECDGHVAPESAGLGCSSDIISVVGHDSPDTFSVSGVGIGSASVVAVMSGGVKQHPAIRSSAAIISVFASLDVEPVRLALLPGASFTLAPRGGPRSCTSSSGRVFESDASDVVQVDSSGTISAKARGVATVRVVCQGRSVTVGTGHREPLAVASVRVLVGLPDALVISPAHGRVLVGSSIKATIRGLYGDTPLSFGTGSPQVHGTPLVVVTWSAAGAGAASLSVLAPGETVVVAVIPGNTRTPGTHELSQWIFGIAGGEVRVTAHVRVILADGKTHLYDATTTYTVLPLMTLSSPSTLRLPPGGSAIIKTTGGGSPDRKFFVIGCAVGTRVVTVDSAGHVHAGPTPGVAAVVVRDDASEQSILITVEVITPMGLELRPRAAGAVGGIGASFSTLPVGTSTLFSVVLVDGISRPLSPFHVSTAGSELFDDAQIDGLRSARHRLVGLGALSSDPRIVLVVPTSSLVNSECEGLCAEVTAVSDGAATVKAWLPWSFGSRGSSICTNGTPDKNREEICNRSWLPGADDACDCEGVSESGGSAQSSRGACAWKGLSDWVYVKVVSVIWPRSPLVVAAGGGIAFAVGDHSPWDTLVHVGSVAAGPGYKLAWESTDATVLTINSTGGHANAARPGTARVSVAAVDADGVSSWTTHADVRVVRVSSVRLGVHILPVSNTVATLTDVPGAAEGGALVSSTQVDVLLADDRGDELVWRSGVNHGVGFNCTTPHGSWISVRARGVGSGELGEFGVIGRPRCEVVALPPAAHPWFSSSAATGARLLVAPTGVVVEVVAASGAPRIATDADGSSPRHDFVLQSRATIPFAQSFAAAPGPEARVEVHSLSAVAAVHARMTWFCLRRMVA